jgi:HEPN domain-containing protein
MDKYKRYFFKAEDYLNDFKENSKNFEENTLFFILQEATKNYLKSILSFYDAIIPKEDTIEELIYHLESKTTIKLPPFKDILLELDYVYCEVGCSFRIIYENSPLDYL